MSRFSESNDSILEQHEAPPIRWDYLISSQAQDDLDRLFFNRNDYFRSGTPLHLEFRDFLEKYIGFRRKELAIEPKNQSVEYPKESMQFSKKIMEVLADLPPRYDQRYRLNFSVLTPQAQAMESASKEKISQKYSPLRSAEIKEVRRALVMFEDFRQRRCLKKICKLKEEQRALPIFAFRDQIVGLVRQESVVLIAGDTGCGKSTQVPYPSALIPFS